MNRALPAAELDGFVSELAGRIARLGPEVASAIKAAVNAMAPAIPRAAYAVENDGLMATMGHRRRDSAEDAVFLTATDRLAPWWASRAPS